MDLHVATAHSDNRLLAALLPADLALLTPHLVALALDQGVLLQEAGDLIAMVYFPQSGMISLLTVMRSGVSVETATVGREGAVGILAGIGSRVAAARAMVQITGQGLQIATSKLAAAAEQSAAIKDMILRYYDLQVALVHQVAGCNALHSLEARLCRWLLQTHDRSESDRLPLTHEFLAEMLGAQRSTVTMVAGRLQELGLIRYARGQVDIVDRSGLERQTCECYRIGRETSRAAYSR